MVTQNAVRIYGVIRYYDLLMAFGYIERANGKSKNKVVLDWPGPWSKLVTQVNQLFETFTFTEKTNKDELLIAKVHIPQEDLHF